MHGFPANSRMWAIMLCTRRKCALRWGKCASSACGPAWRRPQAGRGNGMGQHMCIGAPARMTSGAGPTPGPKRATSRASPREMRSRRGRVAREEAPPASQRAWPFSSLEERAGLCFGLGHSITVWFLEFQWSRPPAALGFYNRYRKDWPKKDRLVKMAGVPSLGGLGR